MSPFSSPLFSVHTRLFGGGEERLYFAVRSRFVLEYGQYRCRTDAVVGTECRTVCRNPFAVDVGVYRIFLEVENLVPVLLGHHIEVGLQDNALAVLHSGRCGFAYIYVVRPVHLVFETVLLGECDDVVAYQLLVVRGARDLYYLAEVLPHGCGFQRFQISVHSSMVLVIIVFYTLFFDRSLRTAKLFTASLRGAKLRLARLSETQ